MKMDFSNVNLEYLIQARDLAREDPEVVTALLDVSRELAHLLAEATPRELALITEIKPPLLMPRHETWWWQRLFKAVRDGCAGELDAVLEHASLLAAPTIKGK